MFLLKNCEFGVDCLEMIERKAVVPHSPHIPPTSYLQSASYNIYSTKKCIQMESN